MNYWVFGNNIPPGGSEITKGNQRDMNDHVIIVGGGINGLCLAFALLEEEFKVTLINDGEIPNPAAPSSISRQIVRAQYAEHSGFSSKAFAAFSDWQRIFSSLKENFFYPTGVLSVSCEKGDWTDRSMETMRASNIPFRYVGPELLRDLLPGINLEGARKGLLADMGGVIRVDEFMVTLVRYLKERGAKLVTHCRAKEVDSASARVITDQGELHADWVFVTAGAEYIFPEHFGNCRAYLSGFADIEPEGALRAYWRYAPIWVDLGGNLDQWGIPRVDGRSIRIGSGALTRELDEDDPLARLHHWHPLRGSKPEAKSAKSSGAANCAGSGGAQSSMLNGSGNVPDIKAHFTREEETLRNALLDQYRNIITDFDQYKLVRFHMLTYHGFQSGAMSLRRSGQCLVVMADSGHGYKFAAQNAFSIAQAVRNDTISMAARQIAAVY